MDMKDDTINLWQVGRTLRREIRWVLAGVLAGVAAGLLALVLLRPQYEGRSTVLLRTESERSGSAALGAMLGNMGGLGSIGGLGDLLPGNLGSELDTELEILASRSVLGAVVDSLHLQARVRRPMSTAATSIFAEARFDPRLPKGVYEFRREGAEYRVRGWSHRGVARPGSPYELPGAVVTLRPTGLPERFRVQLMRREKAIDRLEKKLIADKAAGDVALLVYKGDDPEIAAAVPNAIFTYYEHRKQTTDRGVNQRRTEFLYVRADSIAHELAMAETLLREHQERTGMLDPEVIGLAEVEAAMALRAQLEEIEVEVRALSQALDRNAADAGSGRQLAGYPTLFRSPAVNELIAQMSELETERAALLERRTELDPEVVGLEKSIGLIESQLVLLAGSYLSGLQRQEAELQRESARYRAQMATLPGQAQQSFGLVREVTRLAQTQLVLQMQLLETRLAAIGEGGEIRQIDVAIPPDERSFPRPIPMLAIGLFGGLLLGTATALSRAHARGRIWDAADAELVSGIPSVLLEDGSPLLLGGLDSCRTLLVLPVGQNVDANVVARRIASTASRQGRAVALVNLNELSPPELPPVDPNGAEVETRHSALVPAGRIEGSEYLVYRIYPDAETGVRHVRPALEEMEQDSRLLVAALPTLDHPDAAALLSPSRRVILTARLGEIGRVELEGLVASLRRLEIGVSGLVLSGGSTNGDRHP